jgi:hypothetical protein
MFHKTKHRFIIVGIGALLCILLTAGSANAAPTAAVNQAFSQSYSYGHVDYSIQFQLQETPSAAVNAFNLASATTSLCQNCGANAIAFQIVVTTKHNLAMVNADNKANAVSYKCTNCSTTANAYQFVVGDDNKPALTGTQRAQLATIQSQLKGLRSQHLTADQLNTQVDGLASQVVAVLQAASAPSSALKPSAALSTGTPASGAPIVEVHHQVSTK